jgi:hypothetical protein
MRRIVKTVRRFYFLILEEMMGAYKTLDEIKGLVKGFEDGSLPTSEFNHAAHLTVAVWYLSRLPFEEAVDAMRSSIKAYAAAHGHGGLYHETITLFWLNVVWGYIEDKDVMLLELVAKVINRFGNTRLMFEYYSRERLFSAEARAGWVEPDLKGLD